MRTWARWYTRQICSRYDEGACITSAWDRFWYLWASYFAGDLSWSPIALPFVAFRKWQQWMRSECRPSRYGLGYMWDYDRLGPIGRVTLKALQRTVGA